jgi:DNA-binding transcriptional ArsR family regulator/DNA-binding PadR family transcriptional regulator
MNAENYSDLAVSEIAAAIGEPARVRMLYSLLDGHARTSTELAIVAEVSPSTASAHLNRLKQEKLVRVLVQGKHRYYSLGGTSVARALESLSILAGGCRNQFKPTTPNRLCLARTCYDHIAGRIGVLLHDRLRERGWLCTSRKSEEKKSYDLTSSGTDFLKSLGLDIDSARAVRRRFAYPCLDWSERRPHIGGALGAEILTFALKKRWFTQDLDSRVLEITKSGRRELSTHFGLHVDASALSNY